MTSAGQKMDAEVCYGLLKVTLLQGQKLHIAILKQNPGPSTVFDADYENQVGFFEKQKFSPKFAPKVHLRPRLGQCCMPKFQ